MKYRRFIISNYRAIKGPLEIDVERNSLIPIIGVNESGKTTILHAIFSFDRYNDDLNDDGRQLKDIANLYETAPQPAKVSAVIEIKASEILTRLRAAQKISNTEETLTTYRNILSQGFSNSLTIVRDIATGNYDIEDEIFPDPVLNNALCRSIMASLPYTLYFDDFRDSIDEVIEIKKESDGEVKSWLSIIEELFKQTDPSYSVFDLVKREERQRKSIISRVQRKLNETLTREWQNFRLDDRDALSISIEYREENTTGEEKRQYLRIEVIEKDVDGNEHFFYIRDRSKGFFWFFNFVMKLEFNPKSIGSADFNTIYLLDEPGSYLHASAQRKLCAKLKSLSSKNRVIYCTHSHYLLDPETIPLNTIHVADKSGKGEISLYSIHSYEGEIIDRRSAFQPILDALEIKPFLFDLTNQKVIIAEGTVDYYALEILKNRRKVNVLPSVGAASIAYYISLMIAWQISYVALWDNDDAGREARRNAERHFGVQEASGRFFNLPIKSGKRKNRILQDLFTGSDIVMIKAELGLPRNTGFSKTLSLLYYDSRRTEIIAKISYETIQNFDDLFDDLGIVD